MSRRKYIDIYYILQGQQKLSMRLKQRSGQSHITMMRPTANI